MPRARLDSKSLHSLRDLFQGKVCVATAANTNIDWHHLDENPHNSVPGNIVPVTRELNLELEAYRRYASQAPAMHVRDEFLTPSYLRIMAARWFRQGHAGRTYGASRLATWLLIRYAPLFPEEQLPVASLCESMRALRHAGRLDLLDDVLSRDADWIMSKGGLSSPQKVALLLEFAAAFQDVLQLRPAAQLLAATQEILDRHPGVTPELDARVIRRKAISRILSGERSSSIEEDLTRADSLQLDSGLWISVQNVHAWLELARGKGRDSEERLSRIVPSMLAEDGLPRKLVVAPWEAIESLLTVASARAVGASKSRASDSLDRLSLVGSDPALVHLRIRPIAANLALAVQGEGRDELAAMTDRFVDTSILPGSTRTLIDDLARRLLQR
jgi:hypothetical protein